MQLVDQRGADALVRPGLRAQQRVAVVGGQRAEVSAVLRRGQLEGELGVLQREEPRRACQPPHPPSLGAGSQQQVAHDLRRALAAADHGHVVDRQQSLAHVQVVAAVPHRAVQAGRSLGPARGAADPEHEPAGAPRDRGAVAGVDGVDLVRHPAVVLAASYGDDLLSQPHAPDALGRPLAVGVVLAPQRVERLAHVERVEPAGLLEPGEERVRRRRVGQRDEVGQERPLQHGVVEHHPGVPTQLLASLEEDGVEVEWSRQPRDQSDDVTYVVEGGGGVEQG